MNICNISCDSSGVMALSAHELHNGANDATIDQSMQTSNTANAHHLNVVTKRRRTRSRRSKKRKWLRADCCSYTQHTQTCVRRGVNDSNANNTANNTTNKHSGGVCGCHTLVRSCALPLAPYNTTQFIINDHCNSQMDFDEIDGRIKRMHKRTVTMEREESEEHNNNNNNNNDHNSTDAHNDDEYRSDTDDDDEHESNYYLQQQFHEAYDNIHAERLNSMTKTELVDEYLQLEDRVEDLERRLKESREMRVRSTSNSEVQTELNNSHSDSIDTAIESDSESDSAPNHAILSQQFKKLREENERLRCDNERLQRIVDQTIVTQSNVASINPNHSH